MKILNGITLTGSAIIDANSLTVGTNQLVATNGRIGIGTTSPSQLFSVGGNSNLNGMVIDGYRIYTPSANMRLVGGGAQDSRNNITFTNGTGLIIDGGSSETAGVELKGGGGNVRVTQGNLAVGAITPATALDVSNSDYKQLSLRNSTGVSNQILWAGSVADTIGSFIGNNAYYSVSESYMAGYSTAITMQLRNNGDLRFTSNIGLTSGTTFLPTTRMILTSSGNLLIGTTIDFTTTDLAGGLVINGHGKRDYLIASGTTSTTENFGIMFQNNVPFSADNGLTTRTIIGGLFSPVISNSGASGSNSITAYGLYALPIISSSGATARIGVIGGLVAATRNSPNDLSSNASNGLTGLSITSSHGTSLPSSAVSGTVISIASNAVNNNGTITTLVNSNNNVSVGINANSVGTTTTTAVAYNTNLTVGSATGGTAITTDLYGLRINTITVGAKGIVSNFYGLYIPTPSVSGTLTNRWGLYTTDSTMPSYHAGKFGIGVTNPTANLQVVGEIRTSDKFGYGASAYTQYNSTTKSIDFIFA